MPGAILIQSDGLAAAIGANQRDIVDIETPVIDLISPRLTQAHIGISFAADELLTVDLPGKLHADLPVAGIIIIAAPASRAARSGNESRKGRG